MIRSAFVTRDPATGLRHGGIRWPHGTIPTPWGCRRCGHPERQHGWGYGHDWEQPTTTQVLARMRARSAALDAERERFLIWKAFVVAAGVYERKDRP